MSGQLDAPAALPPRKQFPVPIGQEAGWAPEQVWMLRSGEYSLSLHGNRNPVVQPVAIPTEQSRLQYINIYAYKVKGKLFPVLN
jgi:hypothetical protein